MGTLPGTLRKRRGKPAFIAGPTFAGTRAGRGTPAVTAGATRDDTNGVHFDHPEISRVLRAVSEPFV